MPDSIGSKQKYTFQYKNCFGTALKLLQEAQFWTFREHTREKRQDFLKWKSLISQDTELVTKHRATSLNMLEKKELQRERSLDNIE